jgi:hypothetical protein
MLCNTRTNAYVEVEKTTKKNPRWNSQMYGKLIVRYILVKWFAQKADSNSREREINCSKNCNSKLYVPLCLPEWFFKLAAHNGLTENFSLTLEWLKVPTTQYIARPIQEFFLIKVWMENYSQFSKCQRSTIYSIVAMAKVNYLAVIKWRQNEYASLCW